LRRSPGSGNQPRLLACIQTADPRLRSLKEQNLGVEAHKYNLMRKLDIHNKAQLVHYAYQKKIVRLQVA
jgi:hypothetical protein